MHSLSKNNPVLPNQNYIIPLVITIVLCVYQGQCILCIYAYKREIDQCINKKKIHPFLLDQNYINILM
jgi:hypothetical protein